MRITDSHLAKYDQNVKQEFLRLCEIPVSELHPVTQITFAGLIASYCCDRMTEEAVAKRLLEMVEDKR